MKAQVTIEQLNYFGETQSNQEYNAKVLYRKCGKLYLVHVWIDFFNKEIFVSLNQPKECKVLTGLKNALIEYGKINYQF